MKKVSIQFHAVANECVEFVKVWCDRYSITIAAMQYFPEFAIQGVASLSDLLRQIDSLGDGSHRVIAASPSGFDLSVKTPSEFAERNATSLELHLGRENSDELGESWLVTLPGLDDDRAARCWQGIARDLRKRTMAGAWAENSKTGARHFYRSHRYTQGAREAQIGGIVLAAASEWVRYDVISPPPAP